MCKGTGSWGSVEAEAVTGLSLFTVLSNYNVLMQDTLLTDPENNLHCSVYMKPATHPDIAHIPQEVISHTPPAASPISR